MMLVVDDDVRFRSVLIEFIQQRTTSSTITTAGDGLEALEKAAQGTHDLVLIDLFMPRCSGLEAIPRLRAILPASTGMIALSAHEDDVFEEAALEAGADAFVAKSALARQLIPTIENVCRKRMASPV